MLLTRIESPNKTAHERILTRMQSNNALGSQRNSNTSTIISIKERIVCYMVVETRGRSSVGTTKNGYGGGISHTGSGDPEYIVLILWKLVENWGCKDV